MTVTIHWGLPGSYKSSAVVQEEIVKAAFVPTILEDKDGNEIVINGRVVVTNIRGMSIDRFHEVFTDDERAVLDGFDIQYIDTGTAEGRASILKFWHWVPQGALLVFDEAQLMFPAKLRERELEQLNFMRTVEEAESQNRPHDWDQAWDQHRHFNWDIVLMCPNIRKIRTDIRGVADGAFKHVNASRIGIKGSYYEYYHDADNNCGTRDAITRVRKKIKSTTFALYDSTKTGITKDSSGYFNIFKQPKLLALVAVIAYCGYSVATSPVPLSPDSRPGAAAVVSVPESGAVVLPVRPGSAGPFAADAVDLRRSDVVRGNAGEGLDITHPFAGAEISVTGTSRFGNDRRAVFEIIAADGRMLTHDSRTLLLMGYRVIVRDRCLVTLMYLDYVQDVFCRGRPVVRSDDERVPERGGEPNAAGLFGMGG